MKLYIFFENGWSELGIFAKIDFYNAISPNKEDKIETSLIITDSILDRIKEMPTMEFGFTDSYKVDFVSLFEKNLNKKVALIDTFFVGETLKERYIEVVKSMNLHDLTYEQAATIINNKYSQQATSDV